MTAKPILSRPALLLLCVALAACGRQESAPVAESRPVMTQVAGAADDGSSISYSGEVRARVETALAFRVPGKILSRSVDVGARVKAGQELARLDPADQALGAAGADAQLAAAVADQALAKAELERFTSLREKSFISQAAFDQKKATFDATKARVEALQAQARINHNQSGYTILRADQAGVISQVAAEAGQVVSAGQAVMRLSREDEKEVAISVPESRMDELRRMGRTEVTLWSRQGREGESKAFTGRIREVAPVADPATRTYPVRVSIQGADAGVLLGMTANVVFRPAEAGKTLTVPLAAVFQQDGKPALWVVGADNKVSLRPVKVAAFAEDGARIAEGLKGGERIVTAGVHKLIPGEKVKLLEPAK